MYNLTILHYLASQFTYLCLDDSSEFTFFGGSSVILMVANWVPNVNHYVICSAVIALFMFNILWTSATASIGLCSMVMLQNSK